MSRETREAESADRLRAILARLLETTDGCRPDMHEPDEQDIKARVIGDHLDNAMGDLIDAHLIESGSQEFVVCIERLKYHPTRLVVARFNLADLIALARKAQL